MHRILIFLVGVFSSAVAHANLFEPNDEVVVAANVYNLHYRQGPDHVKFAPLFAAEWRRSNGWLVGGALFSNSFGQFSQLAYGGYLWNFGDSGLYGKVSAGLMHGYKGKYQRKVPFNYRGFSPGVIPAIGYRYGPARFETQFIWTSGLMFTAGYAFR